jgi:hypothetical protein
MAAGCLLKSGSTHGLDGCVYLLKTLDKTADKSGSHTGRQAVDTQWTSMWGTLLHAYKEGPHNFNENPIFTGIFSTDPPRRRKALD